MENAQFVGDLLIQIVIFHSYVRFYVSHSQTLDPSFAALGFHLVPPGCLTSVKDGDEIVTSTGSTEWLDLDHGDSNGLNSGGKAHCKAHLIRIHGIMIV